MLIYNWLDKQRKKDTVFSAFLKIIYSFGTSDTLQTIIEIALGIVIPFLCEMKLYKETIILSVIFILDIILRGFCNNYQKRVFVERQFAEAILENLSQIVNSIVIELESHREWKKKIFKTVSELVCEKIYNDFDKIFNCKTRVSVEYTFKEKIQKNTRQYMKMSGRRSPNRSTCKPKIAMESKKKYFSYKVFHNNDKGIHILDDSKLSDANQWFKNENSDVDVKLYIGIAVSTSKLFEKNNKVDFILQIDCLDDINFGNNNSDKEIAKFINQYLKAYINIISLSYFLNTVNGNIPEV